MACRQIRPIDSREPSPVTVRQALRAGAEFLAQMGIDTSRLDAELLLGKVLGCGREQLYLDYEVKLGVPASNLYDSLLERRARREPAAYITGQREFWSLAFYVTPDVLVPRPETERAVEVALRLVKMLDKKRSLKILDLGTGSGAIAVSLATELDNVQIWATDLSARALRVARTNAVRHGVKEKIHFLKGDVFGPVKGQKELFDLIVSNPSYVRHKEMQELPPEVRDWEPRLALDGGADGLDFYRRIAEKASLYLADGGCVVLEIGADMREEICRLIASVGCYSTTTVYQDYAGKDRVVVTRKLLEADRTNCEVVQGG
ncbi:MAG: peptide chain release factor N(5)-glutamine methyltransferase [Deltaproteobacteria bacterium]|nr:peptide chain release factor N(5)-glutamine methyltransferase [Deltaproteobacteria bacterium]